MPPRLTFTTNTDGQYAETRYFDPLADATVITNDTTTSVTGSYEGIPLARLSNVFADAMSDWLKSSEGYRVLRHMVEDILKELTTIKTDEKETQEAFDRLLSE